MPHRFHLAGPIPIAERVGRNAEELGGFPDCEILIEIRSLL